MDADESDKKIFNNSENDSDDDDDEENSSGEDSEGESDENEDAPEALSDEEDEVGDTESESDDDGNEVASTVTGYEVGAVGAESDNEGTAEEGDLTKFEDPDMSCPICLNEFDGQDLGSPENCSHTFCLECIVEWSKNVNTCPIDRIEFHLIYMKHEVNGSAIKKIKVKVKKEVEDYVEEVTLCEVCHLGDREDRLLLCDSCDSGYHCECLDPPLDTIPIEEWFCPPCATVISIRRAGNSHSAHSRLIARTRASEIVRTRIQIHRTANSEESSSEITTRQPHRVRVPSRMPVRRRTTLRKTKRKTTCKSSKRKATTKARTKATSAGKSKAKKGTAKSPTKRRKKTRRLKSRKTKKSRRSWLASMKLVAPSVKKRIADHLGLCKPPPGHTMPYVKKSGGQRTTIGEQLPSVDMFGCREQLFDFSDSYTDENSDDPRPSTSCPKKQPSCLKKPIAVASTSGLSLLDNILENQNALLRRSQNITIGKDGSLSLKENSLLVKTKSEIKSEPMKVVSEQQAVTVSTLEHVKKDKDFVPLTPSLKTENKEMCNSTSVSLRIVKGEKRTPSPNTLYVKCVKFNEVASSVKVKKEKDCSQQSYLTFDDTEDVFATEKYVNSNTCKLMPEAALPSPLQDYLLSSPFTRTEKKDYPPLVSIKKEKHTDDMTLDSSAEMTSSQLEYLFEESPSLDIGNERHKKDNEVGADYEDSILCDWLLKGSSSSVSPVLSDTQQNHVMSDIDIGTSKFGDINGGFSEDKPSFENCGKRKNDAKREDSSISLYNRAENDRKRHLPFLSNGMQRPFKIPKRAKATEGETHVSVKPDPKMFVKSEYGVDNCVSVKPDSKLFIKSDHAADHRASVKCDTKVLIKSEYRVDCHAPVKPDTKVLKKSEYAIHNHVSMKPGTKVLIKSEYRVDNNASEEVTKESLWREVRSQKMLGNPPSSAEHSNNVNNSRDIDMHVNLSTNTPLNGAVDPNPDSLCAFKPKSASGPSKNTNKCDLNTKYSLLPVPSASSSKNSYDSHNKNYYIEGTNGDFLSSPVLTSHTSSNNLNSNHKHPGRKSHNNNNAIISSRADRVRKCKEQTVLDTVGMEHEKTSRTEESPSVKSAKFKQLNEGIEKMPPKQNLKELIAAEIKKHLKIFYVTDLITKEEYKEIMRRSVPKVLQNCRNSIDSEKIRKLVVSYVHLVGNTNSGCS